MTDHLKCFVWKNVFSTSEVTTVVCEKSNLPLDIPKNVCCSLKMKYRRLYALFGYVKILI